VGPEGARILLEEHGPDVFGVRVSHDSRRADRWEIAGHGGAWSPPASAARSPARARSVVIDDPIKNARTRVGDDPREAVGLVAVDRADAAA
jgi:hypothetical protein